MKEKQKNKDISLGLRRSEPIIISLNKLANNKNKKKNQYWQSKYEYKIHL